MLLGIDNDQTWQWKIILSLIKNSHSEPHQKNMKINGSLTSRNQLITLIPAPFLLAKLPSLEILRSC